MGYVHIFFSVLNGTVGSHVALQQEDTAFEFSGIPRTFSSGWPEKILGWHN